MCTAVTNPTTVHASFLNEKKWQRLKNECVLSFEKPQGKSSVPHPGSGPGPAGRKPDAGVQTGELTLVTVPRILRLPHSWSSTQSKGKIHPRKDWTWDHAGKASLTGPAGDRRTRKPRSGSSLQHSHKQTGVSPLLRKWARHISQALTSVTGEETSDRDSDLQMTTETKHKPASTWCEYRTQRRWVNCHCGNTSPDESTSTSVVTAWKSLSHPTGHLALPTAQIHTQFHIHFRLSGFPESHQKELTANAIGRRTERSQRTYSPALDLLCPHRSGQPSKRLLCRPN